MANQILCTFFVVCYWVEFFVYFGYQHLIRYVICKNLPFGRSFCFVDVFLCCAEAFYFNIVPFVYFYFISLAWGDICKKILLKPMWAYAMFYSRNFVVSCFTFKFLIHVELIFVYYMIGVLFCSFACGCPVFPTLFIEETVLLLHEIFSINLLSSSGILRIYLI